MIPITKDDFEAISQAIAESNQSNTPLSLVYAATAYPMAKVVESTRKAFEDDLIKAYLPIGLPEEELREQYLMRNPHFPDDYLDPHVAMEWTGWKNGVEHGYEIWGKK